MRKMYGWKKYVSNYKDIKKSWKKDFKVKISHDIKNNEPIYSEKTLIFQIIHNKNGKFIKLLEYNYGIFKNEFVYKVRTFKDANEIFNIISDSNLSFNEIKDKISNANYYFTNEKLDKRHELNKLFKEK